MKHQPDETIKIEVKLDVEHDTVWLNTMQMSQLFNREDSNIRRHVGNIFREGELDKGNNVRFLHVGKFRGFGPLATAKSVR